VCGVGVGGGVFSFGWFFFPPFFFFLFFCGCFRKLANSRYARDVVITWVQAAANGQVMAGPFSGIYDVFLYSVLGGAWFRVALFGVPPARKTRDTYQAGASTYGKGGPEMSLNAFAVRRHRVAVRAISSGTFRVWVGGCEKTTR